MFRYVAVDTGEALQHPFITGATYFPRYTQPSSSAMLASSYDAADNNNGGLAPANSVPVPQVCVEPVPLIACAFVHLFAHVSIRVHLLVCLSLDLKHVI